MAGGIRRRHGDRCSRKGRCECPWEAAAAEAWFAAASEGVVRNRPDDSYKPATIRGYSQGWPLSLKPRVLIRPDSTAPNRNGFSPRARNPRFHGAP
jgi:hypothetical protein